MISITPQKKKPSSQCIRIIPKRNVIRIVVMMEPIQPLHKRVKRIIKVSKKSIKTYYKVHYSDHVYSTKKFLHRVITPHNKVFYVTCTVGFTFTLFSFSLYLMTLLISPISSFEKFLSTICGFITYGILQYIIYESIKGHIMFTTIKDSNPNQHNQLGDNNYE